MSGWDDGTVRHQLPKTRPVKKTFMRWIGRRRLEKAYLKQFERWEYCHEHNFVILARNHESAMEQIAQALDQLYGVKKGQDR